MLRGARTVVYHANDLNAASEWYRTVFEREPYFDESFYIGFDIDGYDLGLVPAAESEPFGPGGRHRPARGPSCAFNLLFSTVI